MKIGINLLGESGLNSGSGRFAKKNIELFQLLDNENEYFIYYHSGFDISIFRQNLSNFHFVKIPTKSSLIVRRFAEQVILPWYCWHDGIDRLLSTNNIGCIPLLNKNVMMILDLAHWKDGTTNSKFIHKTYLRVLQWISAKVSHKVITISEFSKQDIAATLGIENEKIAINYLGIDSEKFKKRSAEQIKKTLDKYKLHSEYIFAFSSLLAHKNYKRLFEAFKTTSLPVKLVFGGKRSDEAEALLRFILEIGMEDKIQYIEYPSDDELIDLLSGSLFYTLASYFEGAGTTPLEAMCCQKGVVVGDLPAIREYLGENAVYVDPLNVESIAIGLKKMYEDKELRKRLEVDGYKYAQTFDFEEYGKRLQKLLTE
jgi:glycosyltransferase involved in cell wall biosynthesis